MKELNQFQAELAAEITEENVVSECGKCNGDGFILVEDDWGEEVQECNCIKNYHAYY